MVFEWSNHATKRKESEKPFEYSSKNIVDTCVRFVRTEQKRALQRALNRVSVIADLAQQV